MAFLGAADQMRQIQPGPSISANTNRSPSLRIIAVAIAVCIPGAVLPRGGRTCWPVVARPWAFAFRGSRASRSRSGSGDPAQRSEVLRGGGRRGEQAARNSAVARREFS